MLGQQIHRTQHHSRILVLGLVGQVETWHIALHPILHLAQVLDTLEVGRVEHHNSQVAVHHAMLQGFLHVGYLGEDEVEHLRGLVLVLQGHVGAHAAGLRLLLRDGVEERRLAYSWGTEYKRTDDLSF